MHAVASPARDLHVDERERDGNAEAPFEHAVEEAVPEIVIVRVIAGEALVLEQQAVQRRDACPHGVSGDAVQTHERLLAQPIEQRQERHRVEMSVLEPCDDERGFAMSSGSTASTAWSSLAIGSA
jgi:hypothetical protein